MRTLRSLNRVVPKLAIAVIFAMLAGSVVLAYAQDDKQQDNRAQPDQTRPDDASRPQQNEAKPSRPDEGNPPRQDEKRDQMHGQDQSHPQAAPDRQDHPDQPAREGQPAPNRQMGNDHPENHPVNDRGGRIPDDQFRAHFGRDHHFRARGVIVVGQPRFQYGGYTFELAQPWPSGWAYTDDCYIDYIDGQYYLIDLSHPGIEIPLIVIL